MEKLNLVFYLFEETDPMIDVINSDLQKKDDYQITFVKDYNQLQELMGEIDISIFVFRLIESQDLAQAVGTLQAKKQSYKDGTFKAVCIQKKPAQRKVERLLRNLGCNEFFDTSVNPRTVRFKIDFLGRGIQSSIKRLAHEENTRNNKMANSNEQTSSKEEQQVQARFVAPLKLESDIWIIKTEEDYRKVLGRWLFRVIGPSTRVGSWEFVESKDETIDGSWKYKVDSEFMGQFVVDDGAWYFRGSKPDFDWKISRWNFSSQKPHLFFKTKEGAIFDRFKLDESNLIISKNSEFAIIREKEILETCDGRFAVNKDQKNNDELSLSSHGENHDSGHLRGKGSESENSNNLSGKVKKEDLAQDGPLSGKNKSDEISGHLGGKIKKQDQKNDGPLSGKNKADSLSGHLSGAVEKSKDEPEKEDAIFKEENKHLDDKEITLDKENPKELSLKDKVQPENEIKGKLKKDPTYHGDLQGKQSQDNLTSESELSQASDSKVATHYKGADKKSTKTKDDNVHSFEAKKESGRLSGSIGPNEDEPVNLESGEVEAFIKVNNVKVSSVFEDILAEELFLQVQKGSVKLNAKVEFNLSFSYGSQEVMVTGLGQVGEVESEDDKDMIIVDISDVDVNTLDSFLELYGKRQESISHFLNLAKGA